MEKKYDLEDRTLRFSRVVLALLKEIIETKATQDLVRQLARSATSVGANYLEANDSLGLRDFNMKIKIARREAKEARYWLELLDCPEHLNGARIRLSDEANQLVRILSAIAQKLDMRIKSG